MSVRVGINGFGPGGIDVDDYGEKSMILAPRLRIHTLFTGFTDARRTFELWSPNS